MISTNTSVFGTPGSLRTIALIAIVFASPATHAVDWLMLQGTSPPFKDHSFFGFVQAGYTRDRGDKLSGLAGPAARNNNDRIALNTISPWFDSAEELHIRRLKLGMRGRLSFIDHSFTRKIDYFLLAEVAPNLLTYNPFGERSQNIALDHLSLTFNHIPRARIRVGLFKTPGPEETFQAIHTLDYNEFTYFTSTQIIERYITGNISPPPPGSAPGTFTTNGVPTTTGYGINGVRDWGIEIFDATPIGENWKLSYAAMIGNGEAINHSDRDNNKELYLYLAAEKDLPGGRGAKKHGLKYYIWYQRGKRQFESDLTNTEFTRIRSGLGLKYLGWPFQSRLRQRFGMELMFADGMLFVGPLVGIAGNPLRIAAEEGNRSAAIVLDYGLYLDHNWQLDARFSRSYLLYTQAGPWSDQDERILDELTLGINYHFNKKNRLTLNYVFRNLDAPNPITSFSPPANNIVTRNRDIVTDSVGNRLSLQYTLVF